MPEDTANHPLATIEDTYYAYLLDVSPAENAPLTPIETDILSDIHRLLSSVHDTCNSLPRLPDILPKLLLALRDKRASWEGITDIIAQDTSLVAEVLRLASSPVFHASVKANSLEQVVMQLGMVGLREVVMTVSLKPIMKFETGDSSQHLGRNIWTQAQSTAVACRSLAKALPRYRFEAYLAGLVHNTGMLVVTRSLQKTLQQLGHKTHTPHSMQFRDHIKDAVKQLSFMVAEHWGLPEITLSALKEQSTASSAFESPLGGMLQRGIQLSRLYELQQEHIINDAQARLEALPDSDNDREASQQAFKHIASQI